MENVDIEINQEYLVFIRSLSYNHADFIQEALNGFSSQKTVFPFVCVVVDDFSSDGTPTVIQKWINEECEQSTLSITEMDLATLYLAKHKSNNNCNFAFYLLKQNLDGDIRKEKLIEPWRRHSKYEAICEGDDYWTDQKKLQEQVGFLEEHTQYTAVSSNAFVLRSRDIPMKAFGSLSSRDFFHIKEIVTRRQFHTGTVVFRTSAMRCFPEYRKGDWDTFKWCCLLTQGPIHYDGKVTCVYRKQQQGITESTPRIDWLILISKWADTLIECFVPQYVQRRYVVRSVTRDIIRVYFANKGKLSSEDRETIKSLYRHHFSLWNVLFDMKEMIILSSKKLLRKSN